MICQGKVLQFSVKAISEVAGTMNSKHIHKQQAIQVDLETEKQDLPLATARPEAKSC